MSYLEVYSIILCMKIVWDKNKNINNIIKHKVSFEEASTIFINDFMEIPDIEHSQEEERFIALGVSSCNRELFVSYCYRIKIDNEEVIRIISARKATNSERSLFYVER